MDVEIGVVLAAVTAACVGAIAVAVDQRAFRYRPVLKSTFPTRTFEEALSAPTTGWFRKKLRCNKRSFLRIYALVHAASSKLPAPNSKHKLIKRLALTMMYLAQGGKGYNKKHSKTRIIVESTFGRLKNRFRVLLGKIKLKTTDRRCKLIEACAVLHNLLLDMNDTISITGADPMLDQATEPPAEDVDNPEAPISHLQGKAKRDDIAAILAGRYKTQ